MDRLSCGKEPPWGDTGGRNPARTGQAHPLDVEYAEDVAEVEVREFRRLTLLVVEEFVPTNSIARLVDIEQKTRFSGLLDL